MWKKNVSANCGVSEITQTDAACEKHHEKVHDHDISLLSECLSYGYVNFVDQSGTGQAVDRLL